MTVKWSKELIAKGIQERKMSSQVMAEATWEKMKKDMQEGNAD